MELGWGGGRLGEYIAPWSQEKVYGARVGY